MAVKVPLVSNDNKEGGNRGGVKKKAVLFQINSLMQFASEMKYVYDVRSGTPWKSFVANNNSL